MNAAQTILNMPTGAEIIRFSMQNDEPHVWAIVDTDLPKASRTLQIVGTGRTIPPGGNYIDTCDQGAFVWHLFELL